MMFATAVARRVASPPAFGETVFNTVRSCEIRRMKSIVSPLVVVSVRVGEGVRGGKSLKGVGPLAGRGGEALYDRDGTLDGRDDDRQPVPRLLVAHADHPGRVEVVEGRGHLV